MIRNRLEAYRRKKRKEEMIGSLKSAFHTVLSWNRKQLGEQPLQEITSDASEDIKDAESTCSEDSVQEQEKPVLTKVMDLLYFLLWATLYVIAIQLEFGTVYLVLSALIFLWINTRSGPKKKGELSAYSVFNPNCEAIQGSLDASQFEREIRYGIGGMH